MFNSFQFQLFYVCLRQTSDKNWIAKNWTTSARSLDKVWMRRGLDTTCKWINSGIVVNIGQSHPYGLFGWGHIFELFLALITQPVKISKKLIYFAQLDFVFIKHWGMVLSFQGALRYLKSHAGSVSWEFLGFKSTLAG